MLPATDTLKFHNLFVQNNFLQEICCAYTIYVFSIVYWIWSSIFK